MIHPGLSRLSGINRSGFLHDYCKIGGRFWRRWMAGLTSVALCRSLRRKASFLLVDGLGVLWGKSLEAADCHRRFRGGRPAQRSLYLGGRQTGLWFNGLFRRLSWPPCRYRFLLTLYCTSCYAKLTNCAYVILLFCIDMKNRILNLLWINSVQSYIRELLLLGSLKEK